MFSVRGPSNFRCSTVGITVVPTNCDWKDLSDGNSERTGGNSLQALLNRLFYWAAVNVHRLNQLRLEAALTKTVEILKIDAYIESHFRDHFSYSG